MDLADAVVELYGERPEDFIAQRKLCTARARAAGDRVLATKIAALRKPTVSAWAINLLARVRPSVLEELDGFSTSMRTAQAGLDAPAMRELTHAREDLLQSLTDSVADVAEDEGRPLGPTLLAEVRATFVAAIADPQAQEAVTSGCLTRALSYAGFGEVDLDQALAAPGVQTPRDDSGPALGTGQPSADRPRTTPSAETPDAAQEQPAQRRAEEQGAEQRRALATARDRLEEAEREVTVLSLGEADAALAARRAAAKVGELQRLLERASREAKSAQEAADSASAALAQARADRDAARDDVDRLS